MKLLQYQEQVSGIPTSLAPERSTPDKWQPNTEIPQSNWQAAKIAAAALIVVAPVLAFANPARAERSTPDKWQPETNKPVFDVKRQQQTYPSLFFNSLPLPNPETITVDKWHPLPNQPLFDIKRQQQTYLFFSIDGKQLTQTEQPKIVSQQNVVLTFTRNTQYQGLAYPPAGFSPKERTTPDKWLRETSIPSFGIKPSQLTQSPQVLFVATPEVVTLDKWNHDTERPTPDVKRQQFLYPTSVIDANQLAQKERVSPDKWQPAPNQPLFDTKRQQYTYPVSVIDPSQLTAHERITVDKWVPETGKPLFDVKRQQHTYPSSFFHPEPQEVTQFESPSEFSRNVDRVYDRARNQYLYPSFITDGKLLTQKEAVSFDRWNFNQSIPRFDVLRNQYLYPTYSANILPIEEPAEVQDAGIYQTPVPLFSVKHTEFLYPSFVIDANALTSKERTTPDKWEPQTNVPLFDVKRNQFLYPSHFASIFPIEETADVQDAGIYQTNTPYFPTKHAEYLYQTFGIDPTQLTKHERVTLDKWFKETEYTLWDKTRTQYLNPASFFNSYPLPNTEVVTSDKWTPLTSQPLFDLKRNQFVYPYFFTDPKHLLDHETITVEKWFVPVTQPINVRPIILTIDQANTLFVSENVTLDKWFNQAQQVYSKPEVQFVELSFTPEFTVLTPLVHWFQPTQEPIFLTKSHSYIQAYFDHLCRVRTRYEDEFTPRSTPFGDKYSHRGNSFADKFTSPSSTYNDKYTTRGNSSSDKYTKRNSSYNNKYPEQC